MQNNILLLCTLFAITYACAPIVIGPSGYNPERYDWTILQIFTVPENALKWTSVSFYLNHESTESLSFAILSFGAGDPDVVPGSQTDTTITSGGLKTFTTDVALTPGTTYGFYIWPLDHNTIAFSDQDDFQDSYLQGDANSDAYVVLEFSTQCGDSGGDPHFYGFLQQKYDVMGESFEIYNIITSPHFQMNSRFTPYYKTASQVVPTGTMMGEMGIKIHNHRIYVNSNKTIATIDGIDVSLLQDWNQDFENGYKLVNQANKNGKYEITVVATEFSFTMIRKVYLVAGLEAQFHFDYIAKLLQKSANLHGLLGQTNIDKYFQEKSGAFQYLDGEENDYRIVSNNLFGDEFQFNLYMNE